MTAAGQHDTIEFHAVRISRLKMMLRKRANAIRPGQPRCAFSVFYALIFVALSVAGCGVPGEPVPPSPPIPQVVSDLTATQLGDGVLLTFTLPNKSIRNEKLTATPTLEILRGSVRPDGLPDMRSLRVVDTVPGSVLANYIQAGKVQFLERYAPEEVHGRPGETVVFSVRTRVSERKVSANSNTVVLSLYPVPAEMNTLQAKVTEKSIDLSWTAPTQTSAGEPLAGGVSFFIYRGEIDPASEAAAEKDLHAAVWKAPSLQIGTSTAPEYQDTGFDWGKTYVYTVRSAISVNGALLQSGDSRPVILTPKDIFPPAAPEDLVSAVLPGDKPGTSIVDLSWAINLETDLAGYRVYRSERENERGQMLTPNLLPSPEYRDSAVTSRGRYWYTVTAVDQAGNESALSAALLVEIP
jgi:hypothetical protein